MWNSSSSARSKKRGSYQQRPPAIDDEATEALFAEIADEDDPTVAGMEGISKLCEKLDIDPLEDIRILVLLWKLGSKEKPAQISKEEWISGCQTLQVDSIDKFKELLPSLDLGFLDQTDFRDFYKVCVVV
jgi:DCN1-like protein 1/2